MAEEIPFNEEQIKKLNEISRLPIEQQKIELQKFLVTLNQGQIEFLKRKQDVGGDRQCIFCAISEGKVDSKMIYSDDFIMAVLDINPANKGHVLVFPRKHVQVLGQLNDDEVMHLFKIVNKIATAIFENLKAEGTNIFLANGAVAGQNMPHVIVHVIPRYQGDGVVFEWKGKKMSEEELQDVSNLLTDRIKTEEKVEKKEIRELKNRDIKAYRVP